MPQSAPYPEGSLPSHMYQHLLIGMYAPIGLVLGAPVTLLLRSLPRRAGKTIGRALKSRPLHLLAHPVTALILNVGGLAALYFIPLYTTAAQTPGLHWLIHAHFLLAGYLFAWVIAGPDPAPRRPTVPARLVILGVAIAAHAIISQLLYAGLFVQVNATAVELRQAGELMYYAGDIAELILAFAMVTAWRPSPPENIKKTSKNPRPERQKFDANGPALAAILPRTTATDSSSYAPQIMVRALHPRRIIKDDTKRCKKTAINRRKSQSETVGAGTPKPDVGAA